MKVKHTITAILLLGSSLMWGQSTDEERIQQLIVGSFEEIWSDLDVEKIPSYYTQDFILLEYGEIWTNDSIAKYLKKAALEVPLPRRENHMEFIETKIEGNMAWIAYRNRAIWYVDDKDLDKANWLESATAILTEKGWRLQMLHSTPTK
ncbi:MAG: DUF4440 domain-containing protein [Sediminicola sp.]